MKNKYRFENIEKRLKMIELQLYLDKHEPKFKITERVKRIRQWDGGFDDAVVVGYELFEGRFHYKLFFPACGEVPVIVFEEKELQKIL